MDEEELMRRRLHAEIDRLNGQQLRNITKSRDSLWEWVKSTLKRIWTAIENSAIYKFVDWLWDVVVA